MTSSILPEDRLIVIEGSIGVGKSTLAPLLAEVYNLKCRKEPIDYKYLEKYYYDPGRWAFPLQMNMLYNRGLQYIKGSVVDRGMIGDYIFAHANHILRYISDIEMDTYNKYHHYLVSKLPKPDVTIYLACQPVVAFNRHNHRSRKEEKNIPLSYFELLHKIHNTQMSRAEDNDEAVLWFDWTEDGKGVKDILYDLGRWYNKQ